MPGLLDLSDSDLLFAMYAALRLQREIPPASESLALIPIEE
jgi:hypothetical protein